VTAEVAQRPHYKVTFAVILVATTAYSMLQSLVLPVLPTIQASLHTSQSAVTWVLTAYLLSASVATPIVGRVGDMIGKKKTLVWVLVVLALGTLLAAVATNIGVMLAARVIQGAGGAVLPLSFGIVRDEFPREKVVSAVSTTAALLAVGGGLGIVLAGPIVDILDYHFLFWIPLVLVAGAALAAHFFVPESPNTTPGRINVLPAALLTGWLVALLVGVSEGSIWGWASARTLGLLVASAVLIVAWVRCELRSDNPLIDMKMMRIPSVWTTNLVALLFGVGMYSVMAFLPEFLQTNRSHGYGFGASITTSGLFLLPMTVGMFCCGLWSGPLAARWGSKRVLVLGSGMSVIPFGILAFAHDQKWEIYLVSALLGAGLGFAFAAMSNIIVESVPASQTGVASGMNANIRTIGGSIGAAVTSMVILAGTSTGGIPRESGYTHGFLLLLVAGVLATAAAVLIPTARRRAGAAEARDGSRDDGQVIVRNAEAALVAGATLVEVE
jgi:EmrB/QacA subfamily drug resistance transporter